MLPCPRRRTDSRLQALVLCRHLAGLAELLPAPRQQEHVHACRQLLLGDGQAFQHVGETLGELARREALPKDLLGLLLAALRHSFGELEGKRDLPEPARRGSLWVSLGLLQIQTWLPQARFDPAVKRQYKLKYAEEEVRREGWRAGRGLAGNRSSSAPLGARSTGCPVAFQGRVPQAASSCPWVPLSRVRHHEGFCNRRAGYRPPIDRLS